MYLHRMASGGTLRAIEYTVRGVGLSYRIRRIEFPTSVSAVMC